jgi:hypothetical protein
MTSLYLSNTHAAVRLFAFPCYYVKTPISRERNTTQKKRYVHAALHPSARSKYPMITSKCVSPSFRYILASFGGFCSCAMCTTLLYFSSHSRLRLARGVSSTSKAKLACDMLCWLLGGEGTYFPRAHSFLAAASRFAKVGVRLVRLVRLAKVSASLVVIITSKIAESIAEVVVIIAMLRVHELVIGATFLITMTPKSAAEAVVISYSGTQG